MLLVPRAKGRSLSPGSVTEEYTNHLTEGGSLLTVFSRFDKGKAIPSRCPFRGYHMPKCLVWVCARSGIENTKMTASRHTQHRQFLPNYPSEQLREVFLHCYFANRNSKPMPSCAISP